MSERSLGKGRNSSIDSSEPPNGKVIVLLKWKRVLTIAALLLSYCAPSRSQPVMQAAKQIVQEAVQSELAAEAADHARWIYLDIDQKSGHLVKQWVAETRKGDLKRVLEESGRAISEQEQHSRVARYLGDESAQKKQRKNGQHDDQQARQLLSILPRAFKWTQISAKDGIIFLRFAPNPQFQADNYEQRVFAAMQGEMKVTIPHHRIFSLKGQLTHNVEFGGGLLGSLRAGGTFDVERRQIAKGEWQIVETHVHIQGHALIFKDISDEEDEEKSRFQALQPDQSPVEAEALLFEQKQ